MSNNSTVLSPEKSFWGWKLLSIAVVLSCIFMGLFYLAMRQEPDYMPSQQHKVDMHHDLSQVNAKTESKNPEQMHAHQQ